MMTITCSLLWITMTVMASARTLVVSPEESPGLPTHSRTIGEAALVAQPGDTVLIHTGVYREHVLIEASGTPEAPIRFQAAPGAHVVVTGADHIVDWSPTETSHLYRTPWPHRFITWNQSHTHPDDEYHRLIGRCEQVFVNGYPLRQVLSRDDLTRGTFYVDLEVGELYAWAMNNADLTDKRARVEASTRSEIWRVEGDHVWTEGVRFRYAANRAQQGACLFAGDGDVVTDCVFEQTNASGAAFRGERLRVERCTFQNNGQLGFSANRAHALLMRECVVRANNTKGFNRGWEAGGNKIVFTHGAVIERCTFVENRGNGIWFDIGNEENTVRNCLIAFNDDAGIFYEISYGLHAHDNVIVGNGFAETAGTWGAAAGISLSSSPGCVIERNLLVGNREGFNLREQKRSTPRIDSDAPEPVWNHDEWVHHNLIAYNRDAQTWGWFDIDDERHWPAALKSEPGEGKLSLEDLRLRFEENLYATYPGQGLFHWGVTWKRHTKYTDLAEVQATLGMTQNSLVVDQVPFHNWPALDLRLPVDSPAIERGCYPQGTVPGVQLGTWDVPSNVEHR